MRNDSSAFFGFTPEHIKPPMINFNFILCGKIIHCCIFLLMARVVTCERLKDMLYNLYHIVFKKKYCEIIIKKAEFVIVSYLRCFKNLPFVNTMLIFLDH